MQAKREEVRQQQKIKLGIKAKKVPPGPLVTESKWTEWEPKFENYLSRVFCMNSVPLVYIICTNEFPIRNVTYADFTEEYIVCTVFRFWYLH